MLPARIPRSVPKPVPKKREGMDPDHLGCIRQLPCCICGTPYGVEAHHVRFRDEPDHGKGLKPIDAHALPLCAAKHHIPGIHAHGGDVAYLLEHGINARDLVTSLWRATGDIERMTTIIFKARNHG